MYCSSPEQLQQHLPQQLQKQASNHNQLVKTKVKPLSRGTAQSVFIPRCYCTDSLHGMVWCCAVRHNVVWCCVV